MDIYIPMSEGLIGHDRGRIVNRLVDVSGVRYIPPSPPWPPRDCGQHPQALLSRRETRRRLGDGGGRPVGRAIQHPLHARDRPRGLTGGIVVVVDSLAVGCLCRRPAGWQRRASAPGVAPSRLPHMQKRRGMSKERANTKRRGLRVIESSQCIHTRTERSFFFVLGVCACVDGGIALTP